MNFTRIAIFFAFIFGVLACTHYTVQSGDTLSGIASRYGTTYISIANENGISAPYTIYVGQVLNIGCGGSSDCFNYTVRSGDTLSGIGERYGISYLKIASDNGIGAPYTIYVGQVLKICNGSSPNPDPTPTPPSPSGSYYPVSASQLLKICPNMGSSKANTYLPYLHQAMIDASITTRRRAIDFIAQLAHESGEFVYMEEIADGSAYEGRTDLCNTHPGDGRKYKGRGPIQVTGRCNYTQAQKDTGFNLVDNPYQASEPKIGFRLSAWYWNYRNLNRYCDNNDFTGLTRAINGGTNGLSSRQMYRSRGESVL